MRLTLLGTGSASGMPVYGCECDYCQLVRAEPRLRRSPCSAMLEIGDRRYLIDAGQTNLAERFPAGSLTAIFLTHFHPDHVQGLFHLRWGRGLVIPVYCPPDSQGCADLYKHPGILDFNPQRKFRKLWLDELGITPLPLIHSKPTFGYLFEYADSSLAYLTDTDGLPPDTLDCLRDHDLDLMVIDSSYVPGSGHRGHNDLDTVLALDEAITPKKTVLTHIGHDLDVWLHEHPDRLPSRVSVGMDGMTLSLPE